MRLQGKFERLRFKVHLLPEGKSAEEQFPGLFKWLEFAPYKKASKIKELKYLIYLYDPNSGLIEEFPELQDRKDAAATDAGYERKSDGEWQQHVLDMMALVDETFVPAALRYLKLCNNQIWKEIVAQEEEYDKMYALRLQPVPDIASKDASEVWKKRDELKNMCQDRAENIKSLYKQFYADNDDLKEITQDDLVPVTPENVFRILKIKKAENVS